ncbi:MAG: hypothetical protein WCL23_05225 [Candidatus Moraniibacteriota bacterium]
MSSGEHDDLGTHAAADASAAKIQALREMIFNAERTIHGAKAMLLQIEGKKKTGRPRKYDTDDTEGTVVQGTFDGQFMTGVDGKQYPVPANYSSKSKLVEGDMLKLTITPDGSFIYKQIGPAERRHLIGIVVQDEHGSYQIIAEGKAYRILLASVTYFKLEPGDEVSILVPRDTETTFAALEHVLQKGAMVAEDALAAARETKTAGETKMEQWKTNLNDTETAAPVTPTPTPAPVTEPVPAPTPTAEVTPAPADAGETNILEEWIRDMEALEREEAEKETAAAKNE